MRVSLLFDPTSAEIDSLVEGHPLAQLVTVGPGGLVETPLPLLVESNSIGQATLIGYFARSDPQIAHLEARAEAIASFMGEHGYISPSWFTGRTQAPTGNLATVQMMVRAEILRCRAPPAGRSIVYETDGTWSAERLVWIGYGRPLGQAPARRGGIPCRRPSDFGQVQAGTKRAARFVNRCGCRLDVDRAAAASCGST